MAAHKTSLPVCSFTRLQWVVIGILFFQIVLAEAGEYTLKKKENNFILPDEVKNICHAYVENLNKFKGPMVCDRKIDPDMKVFSKPKWKSIDPRKHPELIDELARFWVYEDERNNQIKKEDKDKKYKFNLKNFTKYAEKKQIKLSVANFDIDNDGKEDRVLHFRYATKQDECNPDKDFGGPYIGNYILLDKQNQFRINKEISNYIFLSSWNVFQYKSTTFFDLWVGRPDGKIAQITVYHPKHSTFRNAIGNTLICRIKYNTK